MVDRVWGAGGIKPQTREIGQASRQPTGSRFAEVLDRRLGEIRFSGHAETRLRTRGIQLDGAQLAALREAVDVAAAKGAKNALILVDDVALVVSVVNRTVVTAMDREQARANVFTQIDSAVITGARYEGPDLNS